MSSPLLPFSHLILALVSLASLSNASPAPLPTPAAEARAQVLGIAVPQIPTKTVTYVKRGNIISALEAIPSKLEGEVNSVLSALGSDIPKYVESGVPNYFTAIPTGTGAQSALSISDSQLAAIPTQVLNVPPYANWTNQGWNVRFHGNVYKQPNTSNTTLDRLANIFLVGTDIQDLPASQQDQARNVTAEIFIVQQGHQNVTIDVLPNANGTGVTESIQLNGFTTVEGDYDSFIPIEQGNLLAGNATETIQTLNTYVRGATIGNATAFLVPDTGFTVISDIDDTLRITKIYQPSEGILNTFARPFTPWLNMPDIYANWSRSLPNMHFHYLTTTPEQITRNYMDFIAKTYPPGSFDTRPLNFSDVSATLKIRKFLLDKIFDTFPTRKFILVGDTSNSDVMTDYPQLAVDRPNQVQCIFMRNVSATDNDKFPYNTKGYKNISQSKYMFFINPDDLTNLDITGGNCYNASVPQNLTFGWQDELLGIHGSSGTGRIDVGQASLFAWAVVALMSFWLLA